MDKPLTYLEALERHPKQVADIIQQVRKGRSKTKNTDPSSWNWSYTWCTEIPGGSFADLFRKPEEKPVLSLEQRVDDVLQRSHVSLTGHSRSSDVSSEVLREQYTLSVSAEMAEGARVAALSPAERDQMLHDALSFLTGPRNKGFVVLSVPNPTNGKSS